MASYTPLKPIRMSDLKNQAPIQESAHSAQKYRYLPPSKRSEPAPVTTLDFSDASFPGLKPVVTDNQDISCDTAAQPRDAMGGFKQKILDLLAKEQLDEIERKKAVEEDPKKMTHSQRIAAGWATLPLTGNLKEAGLRFNHSLN